MTYHAIILTGTRERERIKPLGAFLIADILRKNNFNAIVIDYFNHMDRNDLEAILKKFVSSDTLFVGYSSSLFFATNDSLAKDKTFLSFNFNNINSYIKNLNPKIKIIFGGACSKSIWKHNLTYKDNLGFDYVMHGYSEKMIVDFAQSLKNNQTPKFNNVFNKLYEINYDYKGEGFDFHRSYHIWHQTDLIRQKETLPLEIARGCIFKCKFCAYPLLGKNPNDNSYYKHEKHLLAEVLSNYQKYKTLNYFIVDDTFNERTDKLEMMLRVRDRSKLDLNFVAFNRLELISRKKEQIALMKELNLTGFYFGIESLNYPTAKIIGKGVKAEEIRETIYKLRTAFNDRISISMSLILGLPQESPDQFRKNTEWLFQDNSGVDSAFFNPLFLTYTTHSESDFFKDPTKFGYSVGENGMWFSDLWTQEEAIKTAADYQTNFVESGRQKVSAFKSSILAGYSEYNYYDLIKTKFKDLDMNKVEGIYNYYMNDYVTKLKNL